MDALTQKVREDGRIVNVSVVVPRRAQPWVATMATAVNGEGKREIIGMDVGTSEDGAFWLKSLPTLAVRQGPQSQGGTGPGKGSGHQPRSIYYRPRPVGEAGLVSDAHQGLRGAIAAVFGGASWQRCRTHFMTNLLTQWSPDFCAPRP